MSIFTISPRSRAAFTLPSLAVNARAAAIERKRAKIAASPVRRWVRRSAAAVAVSFALVSLFGSAAQANFIWEDTDNTISNVMNICRPNDSPPMGVNTGPNSETILPQYTNGLDTKAGNGLDRMKDAISHAKVGVDSNGRGTPDPLGVVKGVKDNGFERYGYGSLQWDNFGSSCFGGSNLLNGPANAMLTIAVNGPAVLVTAVLNFALSNTFYDFFSGMTDPFMELFAKVLSPWVILIVLTGGVITILIRSKGSLSRILQLSLWMLAILGLFFGIQNQGLGSQIKRIANNSVTQMSNLIACQVITANINGSAVATTPGGSCGVTDKIDINKDTGVSTGSFKITGGIDQAIWYGIPYQVWSMGAVGNEQYNIDHAAELNNDLGWSSVMMNAKHVSSDPLGIQVRRDAQQWNQAGYSTKGDDLPGQKVRLWNEPANRGWDPTNENGDPKRVWDTVPYLGMVKSLCNDVADGVHKEAKDDAATSRWLLAGNCDAAGANVNFLGNFKGEYFWERGAAIMSGSLAIAAVILPLIAVSLYLMSQKTVFFFILLFAPIFLAIGAFPDEKRMGFAKKYFEFFIANLVKQVVAVCVVLFVMTSVSGILTAPNVPWFLKPLGVIMMSFGLFMFAIPLASILKAAVRGDTSIVEKTLTAPQRAMKTTAKVAGIAAAAVATAGVGAAVIGATTAAGAGTAGALASGAGSAAAGAATKKIGLGSAAKAAKGLMSSGYNSVKSGIKQQGLQGAGHNLARMVKSGEAMRLVRHTGLGNTKVGKILRDGLGLAQVGNSFVRSNAPEDPMTVQGRANARRLGMEQLDAADVASGSAKYHRDGAGKLTDLGLSQASADYEKYFAGDPEGDKADAVSKAALAKFHQNYFKMTGERLQTDPAHPENGGVAPTQDQTAASVAYAMPSSQWQTAVVPERVREGSHIFAAAGGEDSLMSPMTARDTLTKVYDSYGSMSNIDPTHYSAAAMINLGFAMSGKDTDHQQAAYADAMAKIQEYGLPDKIAGLVASKDFSGSFSPATVLSLAPNLDSSSTMEDRAHAAGKFTLGAMTVPADSVMGPAVNALRHALLDPSVSVEQINELKSALANSVAGADVRNPFFTSTPEPAPSAAPAASQERMEALAPAFSAAESPVAAPRAAEPQKVSVSAESMFSSPEGREFVQTQIRELANAGEPLFVQPSTARHSASGLTAEAHSEQLNQLKKDVVAEVADLLKEASQVTPQDSAKDREDGKLEETATRRRSSGLFSNKEGDL